MMEKSSIDRSGMMKGARLRLPEQLSISVGSERMWGEGEKGDDDGVCDNDAEKL